MKKRNIKVIIISIVLTCICGIALPLFMDKFIFANNYPSALSNSDWSGFLGGIWGGIIGGIGTLIAVCITTLDTRDVQEENKKQLAATNHKDKLQTIINTLASYWEKSSDIFKTLLEIQKHEDEIKSANAKIDAITSNLLYSSSIEEQKNELCEVKEEYIKIKSNRVIEVEELHRKIKNTINSILFEYMLLKLLVSDVEFSTNLINLLDEVQGILTKVHNSECVSTDELNIKIQNIQEIAKEFVKLYENRFIKLNEVE